MQNKNIKVSDSIALFLKEKKIKLVFGIIGSANSHIFDSIKKLNYTKIICMHHEQSLTMAMQTYYRVTKKIGVALVTAGGASANAITGVISAWADSMPGIIISGQENLKYVKKYKKNNSRMWGIQGFDSVKMVKNITKYSKRLTNAKNILYELDYCFYESLNLRPGPVWLDIPIDIQGSFTKKKLRRFNLINKNQKTKIKINTKNKVKKLILNSKRPVFWFGNGIKISNAKKLIPKLLNNLKFPFFLSWSALDLIDSNHKLNYGRPGVYGNRASNFILQNSDLIISIGTRLSIPMMGYVEKEFARNSKIIYVDIDKTEYSKFDDKNKFLFYNDDAKNFINFLCKEFKNLKKNKKINKDWLNYCKKTLNSFPHLEQPTHNDSKSYINSYKFIHNLSNFLKKKTCIVTDMGTALLSGHQKINLKKNQMIMTSTGLGEMGYGLPGAIGASFGLNKSEVICLNCDGGIMMNLQELQTIDEYNLPIKTFIFNNDGYLMIKHTQKNLFKGNYVAVNKETNISCPNLKKLATTFNMKYYLIKNWTDFRTNIKKILSSKRPIICEILMNPEQYFHPKLGTAISKKGKIISPPLEDLSPLLNRMDLKKNMIIPIHKKSKEI
jgi:acetolactate synthase I/II/III large subunit